MPDLSGSDPGESPIFMFRGADCTTSMKDS